MRSSRKRMKSSSTTQETIVETQVISLTVGMIAAFFVGVAWVITLLPQPQALSVGAISFAFRAENIKLVIKSQPVLGKNEARSLAIFDGAEFDQTPAGAPTVPSITQHIVLPPGTTIGSIALQKSEGGILSVPKTAPLAFNPQPETGFDTSDLEQLKKWAAQNQPDGQLFSQPVNFPSSQVKYTVRKFRGYTLVDLQLFPVQYNPMTGEVQYSRQLNGLLKLVPDTTSTAYAYRGLPADTAMVKNLVKNPAALQAYVPSATALTATTSATRTGGHYYVIITTAAFAPTFSSLITARSTDPDHQALLVTVEEINARYPDPAKALWEKITLYIQEVLYPAPPAGEGAEYILLGGDTPTIPSYGNGTTSDFYYSQGQIPVGRFSGVMAADFEHMIAKTLAGVTNGTDKVQLTWAPDEYGPGIIPLAALFQPYLTVDIHQRFDYNFELWNAMNTHTLLWDEGHGGYLMAAGSQSSSNGSIRPLGMSFGCSGARFTTDAHPSENYQRSANGNAAYIGTAQDTFPSSFDQAFFEAYFVTGAAEPRIGDMALLAWPRNDTYTLLGDPMYELVSPSFKARPRVTDPHWQSLNDTRSYNTDSGTGTTESVTIRVVDFNSAQWQIANVQYSDPALALSLQFSALTGNQTADVQANFTNLSNLASGTYTVNYVLRDATNNLDISNRTITLYVTNFNILTDEDFVRLGNNWTLPKGEYVLANEVTIPSNVHLMIMPGTVVETRYEFGLGWKIIIPNTSTITALGTAQQPIYFRGQSGAVSLELNKNESVPVSVDFSHVIFGGSIVGVNEPQVRFVNTNFYLPLGNSEIFPARVRGTMTNSLISANNMGMVGSMGDLSGLTIRYSSIHPELVPTTNAPKFYTSGQQLTWGNDFLQMNTCTPAPMSALINAGDPNSPLDPDGSRADIGACPYNLATAVKVPQDYPTIQAAINAATTSGYGVVVVAAGEYHENLLIPQNYTGLRVLGASAANRPVLSMTNNPNNLISAEANVVFENFVIQNIGVNHTGRAFYATAPYGTVGLKNVSFTGNQQNTDVLSVDSLDPWSAPTFYMQDVDFSNNIDNLTVLNLHQLRSASMERWNWLQKVQFTGNTQTGTLLHFSAPETFIFSQGVSMQDNRTATLLQSDANGSALDTVLEFRNCLSTGNVGKILASNSSHTLFDNCTFYGNDQTVSAAGGAKLLFQNNIFWKNSTTFRETETGHLQLDYGDSDETFPHTGNGVIKTEPQFANVWDEDFHVLFDSPTIDAGDPTALYGAEPTPNGGRLNLGSYGNTAEATTTPQACPDGTAHRQCNATKQYCVNGTLGLDNDCGNCGFICPTGYICSTTNKCAIKPHSCLPGKTCPTIRAPQRY